MWINHRHITIFIIEFILCGMEKVILQSLPLISASVMRSTHILSAIIFFISELVLNVAMIESSNTSVFFGTSQDKLSAWQMFLEDRYSILKLWFSSIVPRRRSLLVVYTGRPFFEPKIDNRGLWSVCSVNRLSWRYLWNSVTAKMMPNASFSICEYYFSAGSNDRDACALAFLLPSGSLCKMQAPMP